MTLDAALAAAVGGDERAFTEVFRSLQPSLLRYLRVLAPSTAQDAASETWAAVIPRLGAFQGGEKEFRAWLFTIARSKVIDRARYDSRRPVHLTDDAAVLEGPSQQDVAQEAVDALTPDSAVALLALLPAEQAETITLRVLGGLDTAEVARITGKSAGAVRVAQHRGLKRLAALLEQDPAGQAMTRRPSAGSDAPGPLPRREAQSVRDTTGRAEFLLSEAPLS